MNLFHLGYALDWPSNTDTRYDAFRPADCHWIE